MTIEYVNRTYRITYGGVSLVENALEDPRLIQISVASGTRIMLAPMNEYGIGYLPNGEYRSWALTGYNTRLNKIEKHFIYARLDRDSDSAMILFSVNDYAFDGSYSGGEKSEDYYYVKIGSISETDTTPLPDMKKREITFDYGYLATPADIDSGKDNWKKLFEVTADDLIRPLKRFASFVVQGSLRIIGKVVLNDKVISDVTRQGDEIINKKNDEAVPTTAYLSGKFTEELRKVFLNKDREDQTAFLQQFLGGAVFGKDGFASGLTGFGAKIDKDGNGEMRGLRLWEWLEVPELRYNRVEAVAGIKWRSPGMGIIESCQPDRSSEGELLGTGTVQLKLEDGELGMVVLDDIALGIYHFGDNRDAAADKDDSKGNFAVKGFATTYFRITGVSGKDNNTFTYSLRPGYTVHPQPQMHFVCYGNFTDESRQSSVYETRTYTRMLWKQNTWEIGKKNIALQQGDLTNLNIHGMNMQGYSMYINSVYFTGTVTQVKPDGTPVRVVNDRGAWQAGKYDYYDRVSHNGCLWLCVNEKGTMQEPLMSSVDWLLQVDKGEDGKPGMQGVPGKPGADGKSYYTWIRYADDADGKGISNNPTGKTYIGFAYNKTTPIESNIPGDYTWSLIKGTDGVPGKPGVDGKTFYTWIAYSDNANGSPMYQVPHDKTKYIGIAVNKHTASESTNPADYTWSRFQGEKGEPGMQGVPGKPGADGKSYYTWIRYADDADGKGISNNPTGKTYIGFAYNKTTPLESNVPGDYTWSLIKGTDGVPGEPGADGKTFYTWIAYSDNANGSPMYQVPHDKTKYIGIAVNKHTASESTNPADYTWSRFQGEKGEPGMQGVPGKPGADGKSYYTWIRYADDADGKGISNNPTGKTYIGFAYNKTTPIESNIPGDYTWSLIKGTDGVPGEPGADGKTFYTWIAYSDNANGLPMYQVPHDKTKYIGIAVNKPTASESTNPADYTWSRFQGEKGEQGMQGVPGKPGADGKSYYTWIRYADDADGKGISNNPTGKTYIGFAYNKTTQLESNVPGDYTWSLIKGTDGVPGKPGADGKTFYTWIAYSDNANGSPMYQVPHDKTKYIGIAVNKPTASESTNPADYTWSRFQGEKGEQGPPGDGMEATGEWYDGMHVPRLGVVTMGGKAFVAHRETTNPPMWTVTDHNGRHIVTKQGYILTGEMNSDDYYLMVEDGKPGSQGKDGCIIRDSEWAPGVEYRNDSSIDAPIRYIDVVLVRNDSTASGYDAYRCLRTHVSSPSLDYTFTDFWEKFGSNVGAIFTSLIVAKNAKIRFLQGNELRIEKPDGTVTAGLSGRDTGSKIRFWAGSDDPEKAPYRVSEDGSMVAMKGEFGGNLKAVTGTFNDIRSASEDAPTSNKKEMWLNQDRLRFVDGTKVSALFGTAVMNIMSGIEKCGISVTINGGGNSSLGMCGAYIDVKGAGQGFDNFALRIPHGQISGFRLGTRRINTSVTLGEMDSIVYCGNTQDITVSMPYNAEDGQMYFIRKVNTGRVFISANKIQSWGSENTTRFELAYQHLAIMMYDAVSRWWTVNIVKSGW